MVRIRENQRARIDPVTIKAFFLSNVASMISLPINIGPGVYSRLFD
jgi:hypothetical protein